MKINGNLITLEGFSQGQKTNLAVDKTVASGALRLSEGAMRGEYISPELDTPKFKNLVASWNSDTPRGTYVEITARACIDGRWSDFLSWGKWGADILRACTEDSCELAKMGDDIFAVTGDGNAAEKMQFKVHLVSHKSGVSPVLRRVYGTIRNQQAGAEIVPALVGIKLPEKVILPTPAFSQMTRDPDIGKVMCSATTITVLLCDRGEEALPEEVALANYDFAYEGFGNWAYSVAAAGAWGYNACAQYTSFELIMEELAQGRSVGYSCAYSSSKDGKHTYIENGACQNTAGHLITITGYETVDDVLYLFVSDSAATGDNHCLRRYRADQLMQAGGSKMGYLVREKDAGGGWARPSRLGASCGAVGENKYRITSVLGENIDLPADFVTAKRKKLDCGTLCYTIDGVGIKMPESVKQTGANMKFYYNLPINADGTFTFDPYVHLAPVEAGKAAVVHVYAVLNSGVTYKAEMRVTKPADAKVVPMEAEQAPVYFEG